MTPERIAELRAEYHKVVVFLPHVVKECLDEIERLQTTTKRLRRLLIGIKSFCFNHRARIGIAPPPYCNRELAPEAESLRGLGTAVMGIEDTVRDACDETADIEDDPAWKK